VLTLSGGELQRAFLAQIFAQDPKLLILDEPTNHLDLRSTEWLEEYLGSYKGTVLCISHDRLFLDSCVSRILEIEDHTMAEYSGNYSFYVLEKERRRLEQLNKYNKENRIATQLEATARRMHDYAGKNAKLHKRAFSIEKRAGWARTVDKPKHSKPLNVRFSDAEFLADDVLRILDLSFAYPGAPACISSLNATIRPGDRIALLGDNGVGKTTLLKILTGEIAASSGRTVLAPTLKMAMLEQVVSFAHPERTLIDTMIYEAGCGAQEARDRLGAFHFQGEDGFKTVGDLSGGERSRLRLCILMMSPINLLLLDEPTNHLDIASREWIEQAVEDYSQTLLFISHDRYFISRFASRIWMLKDATILDFPGDYASYREYERTKTPIKITKAAPKNAPVKPKTEKEVAKIQRQLERELEILEQKEQSLNEDMETYSSDATRLSETLQHLEEVHAKWQLIYSQWEESAK
jgi:ATPase subunit of ABC transporter with duplicated ATPase domains